MRWVRGRRGGRGERQEVVLAEIASVGAPFTKCLFEPASGRLCDILVQGSRSGTLGQDALDSVVVEGAKGRRMSEGGVDVFGGVACAQEQDLASLMA